MDYRIEKMDSFKVLCKRTNVKKPTGMENDAVRDITDFWMECGKNGTTEKIISYFPDKKIKGLMEISFSSELNGNKFPYGIGVEYGWGVELEVYPSQDISSPDYTCEIWISVKEK